MSHTSGQQPNAGPKNSAEAVRRVLTTAGITGAALTLSAAAALPALACHNGGGNGNDSKNSSGQASHQSKGQDSDKSHDTSSHDTSSHDSQATKTSSEHSDSDKSKADHEHGNSNKSDKGHSEGDKTQGGSTEGHNPPGNNGTVKIHQTAGDSSPHNQPHVTCMFYVSFFGFDNKQTLNIAFTGQAPTGKGTPITITDASKRSLTSTTDAGGAGNDYDGDQGAFSASNLDLSGITPAKQGYHIKLDISTGQGGGHKYKVFWLTPCASAPGGTSGGTTESGGGTQSGGGTAQSGGGTTTGTGGTPGGGTVAGETAGQGTTVLGESFSKAPSAGSPSTTSVLGTSTTSTPTSAPDSLPFTGAEIGAMSALGLAAVGGGAALTVAGRRRRRAAQMH